MALVAERRKQIVSTYRTHEKDSGSPQVQIAMLTEKIKEVSDHLKGHDKDNHSRRGLVLMVGKRNRLLRYLARTQPSEYQGLIAKLGLRK
jgi:small subunit ribosomal protein S15